MESLFSVGFSRTKSREGERKSEENRRKKRLKERIRFLNAHEKGSGVKNQNDFIVYFNNRSGIGTSGKGKPNFMCDVNIVKATIFVHIQVP